MDGDKNEGMGRNMKGIYIMNTAIPSSNANSVHVVKMCEAFSQLGVEMTLVIPGFQWKRRVTMQELSELYGIKHDFRIKTIYMRKSAASGFRYHIFSLLAFLWCWFQKKDFVLTRVPDIAFLAAVFRTQIMFECHAKIEGIVKRKNILKSPYIINIIVISDALRQVYRDEYSLPEKKITLLRDGVSMDNYKWKKRKAISETEGMTIVYIGSMLEGKGADTVIETANIDTSRNQYHIYGGEAGQIEKLTARYGIKNKNVVFHGYVPNAKVPQILEGCDIALLPNKEKIQIGQMDIGKYTSPLKLFEYMAGGNVIIASDLPILREVLNENNCYFADAEAPESWYAKINYIKSHRKEAADKGENARKDVLPYSWQERAARIIEIIENRK